MSNLMSSSKRTLIYGAIIFSATLVSGVGVNYVLAGSPDAEDVGAELTTDVASGEITQEEADKKLAGLEERLEAWKKDQAEGLKAREDSRQITLEDVEARLKAGVDAGGLTQEQADERLEAWKKDQAEGLKTREAPRRWTAEDVKARIQAAVESGAITQEQADERLEAWKKDQAEGLKAREDFRKIDIEDVKAEIRAALASGKITQEQADEKLAWLEANEDSSRKDIVTDSR